jgi:hypothetical protein
MWVGKLPSYKHLYEYWCVVAHFSISSKCIDLKCEEEMHNAWCNYIGITKPKTVVVVEPTLKTSRQKF